jgi:hypothetical protein
VPDRLDGIIHAAGHVALHHEMNYPAGLVDVMALMGRLEEKDWPRLRERALAFGLLEAVTVVFGVIRDVFGVRVPAEWVDGWAAAQRRLLQGPGVLFLDRFWILGAESMAAVRFSGGGWRRNAARSSWRLALCDSGRQRFRAAAGNVWPSRERMWKAYRVRSPVAVLLMRLVHAPLCLLLRVPGWPVLWAWRRIAGARFRRKLGVDRIAGCGARCRPDAGNRGEGAVST